MTNGTETTYLPQEAHSLELDISKQLKPDPLLGLMNPYQDLRSLPHLWFGPLLWFRVELFPAR